MDKKCEIVQDLLFGYKDNTLHNESKKLVEGHLKTCENCNKIFQELKEEENNILTEKKEIDYLKKVRKKINKKNKLLIIIGIILTIIVIFNICIFSYYYKEAGKLQVFLEDDITQEQMGKIESKILEIDKNANIKYYTKEDSLNEMKSKIENKELLSGYDSGNNIFPSYYIIETNIKDAKKIEENIINLEGVKKTNGAFNINPYLFMISEFFGK